MSETGGQQGGTSFEHLHERARDLIDTGALPRKEPRALYGGFGGSDHHCTLCGSPITAKEVEYELEFAPEQGQRQLIVRFHLPCHAIWDYERKR
jgi:hypothetical protein